MSTATNIDSYFCMSNFASGLQRNNSFIVRNDSAARRTIKIFGQKIAYGQERDLMAIPGISEDDIKASLSKGDLRTKLELNIVSITRSDLNLTSFNSNEITFLQSKGLPFVTDSATVSLGNCTGTVTIDLTLGTIFTGTVTGPTTFKVINGYSRHAFVVDLTMGGAGGYSIAWNGAGGLTLVDPSGALAQIFLTTTPGNRSVGLWYCNSTNLYALGYNAS